MTKTFFEDETFWEELTQDFERIDAIAKSEEKDPLEILNNEYQGVLNDIDNMLGANAYEIKKRKACEKTGNWSSRDEVVRKAEDFKKNWGFCA